MSDTERERFEKAWRVPMGVAFNSHKGWYEATEPYHWGSDNMAAHHNSLFCGWTRAWQHQASIIADLERENAGLVDVCRIARCDIIRLLVALHGINCRPEETLAISHIDKALAGKE